MTGLSRASLRFSFLIVMALLVALAAAGAQPADAGSIAVTTTADELNSDGDRSLREAITAADNGADIINLSLGGGHAPAVETALQWPWPVFYTLTTSVSPPLSL